MRLFLFTLLCSILSQRAVAQQIRIDLDCCTPDDNESFGLAMSTGVPPMDLVLPDVDLDGARFFERGYRDADLEWQFAYVMTLPSEEGERVFVDANVNNDLTDDGQELVFPSHENEISFSLFPRADKRYRVGIQLHRVPPTILRGEGPLDKIIDSQGNLTEWMLAPFLPAPTTPSDFTGEKGTFFFDPYVNLSRSTVQIGDTTYAIGVVDYNHNGRFDDLRAGDVPGDQLLIDLKRNGTLVRNTDYGMFDLDAVFLVDGIKYRTVEVDPFGDHVVIETTDAPLIPTRVLGETENDVSQAIWDLEFNTIDGESIQLDELRGRRILLNFWGEWCLPCLKEMPDLVRLRNDLQEDELVILGMLGTRDLEKAKDIIERKKLSWPHIVVEWELTPLFQIRSWPTNILLLPDGQSYRITGEISEALLSSIE